MCVQGWGAGRPGQDGPGGGAARGAGGWKASRATAKLLGGRNLHEHRRGAGGAAVRGLAMDKSVKGHSVDDEGGRIGGALSHTRTKEMTTCGDGGA